MLERIMNKLVDICVANNATQQLKDNLNHFRNTCQHTSMGLLESVISYLIKKNNGIVRSIEQSEGVDKLVKLLSERETGPDTESGHSMAQEDEATHEELILLANCDLDEIIDKNRLIPRIDFFTSASKIIMDTLRQNSKLLHLYNQVATSLFQFCLKFKSKREYRRLADTLHNHFQQLQKAKKNPDSFFQSKIPYPVKIDDPECQKFLLELRKTQIEYALKMEAWTDAYRTSEIIFTLINKQEKRVVKSHLQTFFTQLSLIFFKSGNYLFHSYALMNQHSIAQRNT